MLILENIFSLNWFESEDVEAHRKKNNQNSFLLVKQRVKLVIVTKLNEILYKN